jgi:hypothetical protein
MGDVDRLGVNDRVCKRQCNGEGDNEGSHERPPDGSLRRHEFVQSNRDREYSDRISALDCRCYIAHFLFRQWNLPGCNAELPTLDGLMTPLASSRMVRDA